MCLLQRNHPKCDDKSQQRFDSFSISKTWRQKLAKFEWLESTDSITILHVKTTLINPNWINSHTKTSTFWWSGIYPCLELDLTGRTLIVQLHNISISFISLLQWSNWPIHRRNWYPPPSPSTNSIFSQSMFTQEPVNLRAREHVFTLRGQLMVCHRW